MGKHVLQRRRVPLIWKLRNLKNRFFFGIVIPSRDFVRKIRKGAK